MKIGYFGSPDISASLLKALLDDSNHEIVFVVSNPDTPRGRSKKLIPTDVSALALERNIPLFRFPSLKKEDHSEELQSLAADLYVVFAYGRLLPEKVFTIPSLGSVNLHASRLPLLRGASPIQSAIMDGLNTTCWTLQYLGAEMDAGDVIAFSPEIPVELSFTAGDLKERLLPSGIKLVLESLSKFDEIKEVAVAQDHTRATYCKKLTPEMSFVDWSLSTMEIHRHVMAMNPSPVARTLLHEKLLRIFRTLPLLENEDQAEIIQDLHSKSWGTGNLIVVLNGRKKRLFVKTGDGFLEILELQPENRKVLAVTDFLNGFQWQAGMKLESPAN